MAGAVQPPNGSKDEKVGFPSNSKYHSGTSSEVVQDAPAICDHWVIEV